jgi:hypothetical protein
MYPSCEYILPPLLLSLTLSLPHPIIQQISKNNNKIKTIKMFGSIFDLKTNG